MAVYVTVNLDIEDRPGYDAYVAAVIPLLVKHQAEIVAADYAAKTLEGEQRDVCVILRFESQSAAMNWYTDPDYVPVKQMRINATSNATLMLGQGFEAPSN
ncbi:MAG: hypothetical protein ACI915_001137 [Gammaproteobacteria bacterium]|jgi:uncharacterized protein (DUF1330 family)